MCIQDYIVLPLPPFLRNQPFSKFKNIFFFWNLLMGGNENFQDLWRMILYIYLIILYELWAETRGQEKEKKSYGSNRQAFSKRLKQQYNHSAVVVAWPSTPTHHPSPHTKKLSKAIVHLYSLHFIHIYIYI